MPRTLGPPRWRCSPGKPCDGAAQAGACVRSAGARGWRGALPPPAPVVPFDFACTGCGAAKRTYVALPVDEAAD